jgi:hypothetical protein
MRHPSSYLHLPLSLDRQPAFSYLRYIQLNTPHSCFCCIAFGLQCASTAGKQCAARARGRSCTQSPPSGPSLDRSAADMASFNRAAGLSGLMVRCLIRLALGSFAVFEALEEM